MEERDQELWGTLEQDCLWLVSAKNNKGRYTLGDKLQQHVAATDHSMCTGRAASCSNKVRRHVAATNRFVCTGELIFVKIFVSATEFSSTHEAICRCNVSPRHVATTCRLVCTNLKSVSDRSIQVCTRAVERAACLACERVFPQKCWSKPDRPIRDFSDSKTTFARLIRQNYWIFPFSNKIA